MTDKDLEKLQGQVSMLEEQIKELSKRIAKQDDNIKGLTSINRRLGMWSIITVVIVLVTSVFFTIFAGKMACRALQSTTDFKQIIAYGVGSILLLAILAAIIITWGYFTKEIYTSLKDE